MKARKYLEIETGMTFVFEHDIDGAESIEVKINDLISDEFGIIPSDVRIETVTIQSSNIIIPSGRYKNKLMVMLEADVIVHFNDEYPSDGSVENLTDALRDYDDVFATDLVGMVKDSKLRNWDYGGV